MKKSVLIIMLLMLSASPIMAQQAGGGKAGESRTAEGDILETHIGVGWYGINQRGNTRAGEYYYLKDSPSAAFDFEWDPLPHRFAFESYFLNPKDYFGELDYAYRDVLLLNGYVRDLFHNLDHYNFGLDDPTTPSPSFTDLNPADIYGIENRLSRGFVRLKTPDFAFHLYADARTVDREGTIQQRFLSTLTTDLNKVSQSRNVDWKTSEYRVGVNSHLGPIEADYSHAEKKFEAETGKVLYEVPGSGPAIPHNLISDLKSSSDTVKLHTTYSGKVVVSGTYSTGDRKNEDSGAKVDFNNAAGDLMIMPFTSLILTVKYRHFENDVTNPDTVDNITVSGVQSANVRDSISSTRDVVSSVLRYRASSSLTLRAEYQTDTTDRTRGTLGSTMVVTVTPPVTGPAYWWVPESTTKNTIKAGLSYRFLKKMFFRADYSQTSFDNPAYAIDPDKAQAARAALSWMPAAWLNTMLSYGMVREKRDELGGPLGGGSREAARDQGLASATMMIGNRSSLTASYGLYKNKVDQTITLTQGTGDFALEPAVPYEDTANVGSLVLTVAPRDGVTVVGSATKSYSRGDFRLAGAGTATNVSGIAELSDLKIIDTVYEAGLEMEHSEYVNSEVRYQYRRYDDEIDNTQDGIMKLILATVSVKWYGGLDEKTRMDSLRIFGGSRHQCRGRGQDGGRDHVREPCILPGDP
jgi:hypothetical protein